MMKKQTSLERLCHHMPDEFIKYLKYSRNLKFKEKPDYKYLINLFKELYERKGYNYRKNYKFDWQKMNSGKKSKHLT